MIPVLTLLVGLAIGWFSAWREVISLKAAANAATDRAEKLLLVVLAKEAPRESGLYLEPATVDHAAPGGHWSEDGLVFIEDDEDDKG